jgi:hypothetical protein
MFMWLSSLLELKSSKRIWLVVVAQLVMSMDSYCALPSSTSSG